MENSIEEILECIDKIENYTKGFDFENFTATPMVINAVVKNIEIIGEASKQVPDEIKEKYQQLPWKEMAGIRNRIVHEYFGVDVSIIWFIISQELAPLKKKLIAALK